MKKVLIFICVFLVLFLTFDPLNLSSDEPKNHLHKNLNKEELITIKLEDLNVLELNNIDLDIRKITSIKNGSEFVYFYSTTTNLEKIFNSYKEFLEEKNLLNDIIISPKYGFKIDTITTLESVNKIKEELKEYKFEVIL